MGEDAIEIATFAEIAPEFKARTERIVWSIMATVDRQNRPRSRVVHPVWFGNEGWLTTRRGSHKGKHLAENPYVSFAYYHPAKGVYIDCLAEWVDDLSEKRRVWDLIAATPSPAGFDPAPIYQAVDDPGFGLLRLTPWRIELPYLPEGKPQVWHNPAEA